MKNSGVYMIRCDVNDKKYVGSSQNLKQRIYDHKKMLRDGIHHCIELQEDYDKYGDENFEIHILEYCDEAEARKKELEYINKLNLKKDGYNSYDLKTTSKKKHDRILGKIFEYVKSKGYESDGNLYIYNIFDISTSTKYSIFEILNCFGVNSYKQWNINISLDNFDKDYLGLNWNNDDGLVLTVFNEQFFDNSNSTVFDMFYEKEVM
ncbi:GIY-YIG nuclease family protein [Fusobacterium sp.]|uniref:GIY-YIG nuclease family protein n=1 Tax=Fusobacterium sp. TaxID=68766 RepID=UPI00263189EA|nr:GIY-YIG nuclease family protein [Fusobacterium sp.]